MDKIEILKSLVARIGTIAQDVMYAKDYSDADECYTVVTEYGSASTVKRTEYDSGERERYYIAVFPSDKFKNQYEVIKHFSKIIEDLKKEAKQELDNL